jgi:hypothetical protein
MLFSSFCSLPSNFSFSLLYSSLPFSAARKLWRDYFASGVDGVVFIVDAGSCTCYCCFVLFLLFLSVLFLVCCFVLSLLSGVHRGRRFATALLCLVVIAVVLIFLPSSPLPLFLSFSLPPLLLPLTLLSSSSPLLPLSHHPQWTAGDSQRPRRSSTRCCCRRS